jgi:Fur family transcriptional regulator, zinc uptake regulator
MTEVFHDPAHNHARCAEDVIAHAEKACANKAQKLTPMRRKVLEILASSHKPLGAYEIIDAVAGSGPRPAPITIYRALDFLMANGLVHRIASKNAFLACGHNHDSGALVTFLICEVCGTVGEAPAADVSRTLTQAAQGVGFTPKMSVVEITGLCAHCREQRASG